jgi:hypothetical protein
LQNFLPLQGDNQKKADSTSKTKPDGPYPDAAIPFRDGDAAEKNRPYYRKPEKEEVDHEFSLHDLTKMAALTGCAGLAVGFFAGLALSAIQRAPRC